MAALNLTAEALAGYRNDESQKPAYESSPAGMAYLTGLMLRGRGAPPPRKVTMSRGYSVRVDGVVIDTMTFPSYRDLLALVP